MMGTGLQKAPHLLGKSFFLLWFPSADNFWDYWKEVLFVNEKKCYSVKELQEILMVSRPTIYDLLKKKEFKWGRCKGKYWISKKSFDEWFDGPDKSGNGDINNPLEESGRRGAILFEEAFYGKENLNPQMIDAGAEKMITVPDGVDAETLMKVLGNPEMVALLSSLAKTIQN